MIEKKEYYEGVSIMISLVKVLYEKTDFELSKLSQNKIDIDGFREISNGIYEAIKAPGFDVNELYREGALSNHLVNVAVMSGLMADYFELEEEDTRKLIFGSLLHDIGKESIPKSIIDKPGRLTKEEREIIDTHPIKGQELVKEIGLCQEALDIITHHHSYIKELPTQIILKDVVAKNRNSWPLICSVADITDAIVSKRPYKQILSVDFARQCLLDKGILDIDEIYHHIGIYD